MFACIATTYTEDVEMEPTEASGNHVQTREDLGVEQPVAREGSDSTAHHTQQRQSMEEGVGAGSVPVDANDGGKQASEDVGTRMSNEDATAERCVFRFCFFVQSVCRTW